VFGSGFKNALYRVTNRIIDVKCAVATLQATRNLEGVRYLPQERVRLMLCGVRMLVCLELTIAFTTSAQITVIRIPRDAQQTLTSFETRLKAHQWAATPDQIVNPKSYPRSQVDSVVDGLVFLALNSESDHVKHVAARSLADGASIQQPIPGIFDRMLDVYSRSPDNRIVHIAIISSMQGQRDRARALAFLKTVALTRGDPNPVDGTGDPMWAVETLSHMGPAGRAALIELRNGNKFRNPAAVGYVNWFLQQKR
jgi:hypothetical protein